MPEALPVFIGVTHIAHQVAVRICLRGACGHHLGSPRVTRPPPGPVRPLYLGGIAHLGAAVTGISHAVLVPVCLQRVGDFGTVVQPIGDAWRTWGAQKVASDPGSAAWNLCPNPVSRRCPRRPSRSRRWPLTGCPPDAPHTHVPAGPQRPSAQACTIPIHVVVARVPFPVAVCVLLVIVGHVGTVVTGITK